MKSVKPKIFNVTARVRAFLLLFSLLLSCAGAAESSELSVKFLVTPGAGIRAFTKPEDPAKGEEHFTAFTEYPLTKGADENGYEVYTGIINITGERFHYTAGGGDTGFLKTARIVYPKTNETAKTITVDVETLNASHREDNGFKGDDVYFNVNDAQHLVLNAGDTFNLIPIRVWQAMEGLTDNYFIEPDYRVEVLGDAGAVSSAWNGSPGLEYAKITGLKPGVAILRVSYGPVRLIDSYEPDESLYFNAIDPINTGIVVVTVTDGNKTSGVTTNIKAREYDTVYFDKAKFDRADHAEYTFTPSGASSVRVHKPIHGGAQWNTSWSDGVKNSDGSFTVKLYEGRNIVEISGGENKNFKEYHVVNAKGITVKVTPSDDKLKISFLGIKTPLEKIAGIYNPGFPDTCYVKYSLPNGEAVEGSGVQYTLFDPEDNAITVLVPESGNVELTGGVINCDHLGDPLGSHRTRIGHEPIYRNLAANNVPGVYSVLPDVIITGQTPTPVVPADPGHELVDAGAPGTDWKTAVTVNKGGAVSVRIEIPASLAPDTDSQITADATGFTSYSVTFQAAGPSGASANAAGGALVFTGTCANETAYKSARLNSVTYQAGGTIYRQTFGANGVTIASGTDVVSYTDNRDDGVNDIGGIGGGCNAGAGIFALFAAVMIARKTKEAQM